MNVEYAHKREIEDEELVHEESLPKLKEPAMYQIVMYNDDFTPMEFVVAVLEEFFNMERVQATRVMYEVHTAGKAVCGVYSKDIAETKVEQVIEYARRHEHPLRCVAEVV